MKTRLAFPLCLAAALSLVGAPALADRPAWAGGGHGKKHEERDRHDESRGRHGNDDSRITVELRFNDSSRRAVGDYYGAQIGAGRCPPGLAKKHNGCQPPGQARQWSRGRPLPRDLRYYDLPRELLVRLPLPPANHRYVRVASDILMIAIGTSMVVDAIEDLGR